MAFNSATHNKPSLVRDLLTDILPNLYNETKVRVSISVSLPETLVLFYMKVRLALPFSWQKELIREVEMGPFKHTVDDGLDLRKAAFECMYTLLETCLDQLDVFEFLNHIEDGLRDHYDIKVSHFGPAKGRS